MMPESVVIGVGPLAARIVASLADVGKTLSLRPTLAVVTADFRSAIPQAPSVAVLNLAGEDNAEMFKWCRDAAAAENPQHNSWIDPLPGFPLTQRHAEWMAQYHQRVTGRWDEFFRSLELKSARTAHVTGSLFDAAAILLPTVFVETAKTPGESTIHRHVHAITAGKPRSTSSGVRQSAYDEAEVLARLLRTQCSETAFWFPGAMNGTDLQTAGEIASLLARLAFSEQPDPLSEWLGSLCDAGAGCFVSNKATLGSYRCGPDAVPVGFPELRVPAHREDLLNRVAMSWNRPVEIPTSRARSWNDVRGPFSHDLPGALQCFFWAGLAEEDLPIRQSIDEWAIRDSSDR